MGEADSIGPIEIGELFRLLPHRYPFLLIDRIESMDGDNSAIGIKNVTVNEPHFNGHFPGEPIMPGFTGGRIDKQCVFVGTGRSLFSPERSLLRKWSPRLLLQ